MIKYKFESLVSNLIEGLSSFMWSASKDIGRTMDPCWNSTPKSVHILSTIYFPWIYASTMITLTTPNERLERICIASRRIYLLSSLTLQVILKYLFACLTSYPNLKFCSLIRIWGNDSKWTDPRAILARNNKRGRWNQMKGGKNCPFCKYKEGK